VTLRTKRRKNATETIDTGIETQAKDRIAVNREITLSAATKIITSNKIMETPTVVKVEATVVTQEADPATTTAMGEEIKTRTEAAMHTDKMDVDKTIKIKATATPNADTILATKSDAEKTRHTRSTQTMKAMMDKKLTFRTKAMTMPPAMNFTSPTKSFTTRTRPMTRKKMTNLLKLQMKV
jgi:alpha-glucosidase (family GH31 glycosyl hydrolase)